MSRIVVSAVMASAVLAAQPSGTGVIGGVVIDHATGSPVRKAVVSVAWRNTPPAWASVQTDASGRFQVTGLPPASYTVSAMKEGFGSGSWGDSSGVAGKLVTLAAGEQRLDLVVRIVRTVLITGVVKDNDNEPLMGAEVQVGRLAWPRGKPDVTPTHGAHTNDRGEYRLVVPQAGRYYLSASARDHHVPFASSQERPLTYGRQYYGGGDDWRKAKPIVLQPGRELKNIDFHLTPERTGSLHGRITNMPPMPQPGRARGVMFQMYRVEGGSLRHHSMGMTEAADGTFQMSTIPPGTYTLLATVGGEKPLYAMRTIDINGDVDGVELTLVPAVALRGRLVAEGPGDVPVSQLSVELTSPMGRPMTPGNLRATPAADGSFTFPQVPPGIWDIDVKPVPSGGFIKSIRLGEQDVLTEDMQISSTAPPPLHIVVSPRGGEVTGELPSGEGVRDSGIMFLLAPVGKFRHVMSFYRLTPVSNGKFKFTGVTPGKYRLLAYEQAWSTGFDMRNPDLLDRLREDSVEIDVAEGAKVQATPRLVRAARLGEAMAQ